MRLLYLVGDPPIPYPYSGQNIYLGLTSYRYYFLVWSSKYDMFSSSPSMVFRLLSII